MSKHKMCDVWFPSGIKCLRPAVAQCSKDVSWHVCDAHYLPAAGNGFFPRRYIFLQDRKVRLNKMSPEQGAELYRKLWEAQVLEGQQNAKRLRDKERRET